jgi:hypothetical protein
MVVHPSPGGRVVVSVSATLTVAGAAKEPVQVARSVPMEPRRAVWWFQGGSNTAGQAVCQVLQACGPCMHVHAHPVAAGTHTMLATHIAPTLCMWMERARL